ncbi:MAG TPA: ferritin-like domain-containing protein [Spirochaetales bacterium]|nr:ferritin-like domain-containing protein [Spirochaetales bacterium]
MSGKIQELINMLNKALEMEQAANVQYLSMAELVDGLNAEPIIERLQEIAGDEQGHAVKLRTLINDYLDGVPSMALAPTKKASTIEEILKANLKDEKEAVDYYLQVHAKIAELKNELAYAYQTLEHDVRHILTEEQEHIAELRRLLGYNREQMLKL